MQTFKRQLIAIILSLPSFVIAQSSSINWTDYDFKNSAGISVKAELGKISVPENRKVLESRQIELSFVRFKSTNPNPGNPIIYLAGGPGGSGIEAARGDRFDLFMSLREVADVIAFDQRGTGLSNHIPTCQSRPNIDVSIPGSNELYISKMSEAAKECISFWKSQGVEIEGYNTMENASDLNDLRIALGVSKINLWGISYGSHLAFNYIKRFEDYVDQVVLTGLEGPDETIKMPSHNQRYLERLNSAIQNDKIAREVYPDLILLMNNVHSKLEKEPVSVPIKNRSGNEVVVGISKLDVQLVTSFLLTKNPEDAVKLPLIYQQMQNGEFQTMAQMVFMLKSYMGRIEGMPLCMDAMSGVSKSRWNSVLEEEKSATLGRTTNFPFPDIAKNLGLPFLENEFRINPISSVRSLFFTGTLDGRTYMESSAELAKGFKNSSQVVIDGAGHDLFMSTPAVTELMKKFFKGENVTNQTIQIKVPAFAVPRTN